MNKIIFFILFLASITLNSQNNISKTNWKAINKKIDSIQFNKDYFIKNNETIEKLQSSISKLDSLEHEILFYRIKEDYYSAALSEQSTRFALIISGILALFAIVSFGAFKYEVKQIEKFTKKQIDGINSNLEESKKNLEITTERLIFAEGNLNTTIAQGLWDKKQFKAAFRFFIIASWAHRKSNSFIKRNKEKRDEDVFSITISNLKSAHECLKQITKLEDIEWLRTYEYEFKDFIDNIYGLDSESIKNKISEIRVLLKEKFGE